MLALNLALEMAIFIFLGFLLVKLKLFPDNFDKLLSTFVLDICLPCLIVKSMNVPYDPHELSRLFTLILLCACTTFMFFCISMLVWWLMGKDASGRIARFGITFSNYTYMGMPVMETLYGSMGLFYYTVFTMPIRFVYYIFPVFLMRPPGLKEEKRSKKQLLKEILCPPVVGLLVGVVLYFANVSLPDFLSGALSKIGGAASPLGMIVCGMALARLDIRKLFKKPKVFITVAVRSVICPLLVFFALWLLKLDIDPMFAKIAVVYSGLPVASMLTTFAMRHESRETVTESSVAVFVTTIISIATLPLLAQLAEMTFK